MNKYIARRCFNSWNVQSQEHDPDRVVPDWAGVGEGRFTGWQSLNLSHARLSGLGGRLDPAHLIVTVCDSAHDELDRGLSRWHWSVPNPARIDTDAACEPASADIDRVVHRLAAVHRDQQNAS